MDNFEDPSNLIVGEELLAEARLMAEEKKKKTMKKKKTNSMNILMEAKKSIKDVGLLKKTVTKKIYRNVRRPRSLLVKSNPTEEVGLPERTNIKKAYLKVRRLRNLQKKG